MAEEAGQKTEAASQKKLDDAAKRGEVAIAAEVKHLGVMAALLAIVVGGLHLTVAALGSAAVTFWGSADQFRPGAAAGAGDVVRHGLFVTARALAVPTALIVAGVTVAAFLQGRFVFSSDRVAPKWSRVSPAAGLKRLVGAQALLQFGKTLVKLAVVGGAVATQWDKLVLVAAAGDLPVSSVVSRTATAATGLLWTVVLSTAAVALLDMVWSRVEFARRMRMSREELKREFKDQDGDPHVRARLRARRAQISRHRAMAAVGDATVLIVNPTHYAVALDYRHGESEAPRVTAKGMDSLALAMRAKAEASGVPVVENVELARALHAGVEVDQFISLEFFEAVAKVIGALIAAEAPRA